MNGESGGHMAIEAPPEGVIAGESVPRENDHAQYWGDEVVESMKSKIKTQRQRLRDEGHDLPRLSEKELKDDAIEYLNKMEESR